MKKSGFTLAEVMVALALIGVIASLTIPTFISNTRNRANAARLSAISTNIENAFASMVTAEAVHDLSETEFGNSQSEANLHKYLKLAGSNTTLKSYYGTDAPIKTLQQAAVQPAVTRIFQTKNGALLIYRKTSNDPIEPAADGSHPGSLGILTIDVNGAAKPNIWGRDVFLFRIGLDSLLYPAGGKVYKDMDSTGSNYTCTDTTKNQGCTNRLVQNNYEIDF